MHPPQDPVGNMMFKLTLAGIALIMFVSVIPAALNMFTPCINCGIGGIFTFGVLPFAAVFIIIYMIWYSFTTR